MYRVTIINDGIRTTIHNPLPDKKAAKLLSGTIKREINAIPSFTFEMGANNQGLKKMCPYKTKVEVKNLQTGRIEFEGRVLIPTPSMSESGEIRKKIVCEGIKAYLHDSMQPYLAEKHWEGDESRTGLEEFIDCMLGNHNGQVEPYKRIYRGRVTIKPFAGSDNVTKGLNYQSTYDCIKEKLIDSFGGEFDVRRGSDGLLYLDYVEEFGSTKGTEITIGINMQSMSQESDPTKMITRLIPLGAKLNESEERLTIESVNDGKKYVISEEAERAYGIHYGTVEFDDITTPAELKTKGEKWLAGNNLIKQKNTVTALELGLINKKYELFELCNYYPIKNQLIGVDTVARVTSQTIDIISPEKSSLTIGDKTMLLSDYNINQEKDSESIVKRVEEVEKNYELNKEMIESLNESTKTVFSSSTPTDTNVLWIDTSQSPPVAKKYNEDTVSWEIVNDTTEIINSIREDVKSVINQLPDQIDMSVKSQTYLKGEVDTLVNEVKSMLTQTENELSITLSELRGSIDDVDGKIDASLENYETYFKFRATGLYIGKNDSTIKLRLSNDRLSFTENDVEVAYISDRKMYITELEVTGDIIWDGWGFTHESNESRSYGKIR